MHQSLSHHTRRINYPKNDKLTIYFAKQPEDPRLLAQQRAAKMRAAMEVSTANTTGRSSTASSNSGMIRSKIRHHGAPKAQQYTPHTHPASGVPMRLSANEVDEDDSEEENGSSSNNRTGGGYHQRSGSGRSSVGSGRVGSLYMTQATPGHGNTATTGSTPSSAHALSPVDTRSPEDTPVPDQHQSHRPGVDYFGGRRGSEDSEELNFGGVGGLPRRVQDTEAKKVDLAELRRRGSVDDRTMTMSGYGRLFVANPDV